jgi:hypothetical protein
MRRVMSATTGGAVLLLLGGCSHLQDVGVPLLYSRVVLERIISGCGEEPKVDVTPTVQDDRVVFAIQVMEGEIDGLVGFEVQDEDGKTLWDVHLSCEKGNQITYGVLPTNEYMPARQEIPSEGEAPPDIRGKTVTVTVEYMYVYDLARCSSRIVKKVAIPRASDERNVSTDHREPPSSAEGAAPK